MKLKRMAVVAAAAVVGPTVLMATPAMADEAQTPAVTTPDAAPKEDAAPAAETPAKDAKPAAETPAKEAPAPAPAPAKPAPQKPAPAPAPQVEDEDENLVATGPVLGINGVPGSFKAGGDWTNLTYTVDNSKGKAQESYVLVLAVADEAGSLDSSTVKVQVFYQGAWHDVDVIGEDGAAVALLTDDIEIPAKKLSLQVRVKFTAGAPAGQIAVVAAGGSNVDEDVFSDTAVVESKIVKGSTGGGNTGGNTGGHNNGGNTGGNNNTKPNGGGTTTPIVDTNTGSGNTGGSTNTGGELAETGADAATSWALGAGGVALAMGAALVAGTGRRRRVTN
ncbi:LPXTG cell wall anchor domain-containing protein [Streptomyces sp. WAC07149]|uniref:LPXTG cell wall anchor domain-containing protein n=1 Tax=Streptomyces sp. WAC07149 TaxID=2487425 RepID=UPI00163CD0BB|nr:LPXTG cell wall anchor domain-containing protein [Streptomyces sp. WAC07149]